MEKIFYEFIRSARKTMAIQIAEDGKITVRAPYSVTRAQAERFLNEKMEWILKQQEKLEKRQAERHIVTEEERKAGIALALERIPERVRYYAGRMGVTYSRITIREQKTRWGSCSSKGGLNFNWKLVLMPEEVLDYVVVHELAHRKEMNHSKAFWAVVEAEMPDYRQWREWLAAHGSMYSKNS